MAAKQDKPKDKGSFTKGKREQEKAKPKKAERGRERQSTPDTK